MSLSAKEADRRPGSDRRRFLQQAGLSVAIGLAGGSSVQARAIGG